MVLEPIVRDAAAVTARLRAAKVGMVTTGGDPAQVGQGLVERAPR